MFKSSIPHVSILSSMAFTLKGKWGESFCKFVEEMITEPSCFPTFNTWYSILLRANYFYSKVKAIIMWYLHDMNLRNPEKVKNAILDIAPLLCILGTMNVDAIDKVGPDGVLFIEYSSSFETTVDV